jgi:hypothetical protein
VGWRGVAAVGWRGVAAVGRRGVAAVGRRGVAAVAGRRAASRSATICQNLLSEEVGPISAMSGRVLPSFDQAVPST